MQNSASPEPPVAATPKTLITIRGDTMFKTHPDGRMTTAKISGFGPSIRLDQVNTTSAPSSASEADPVLRNTRLIASHDRVLVQLQHEVSVIHHQRIVDLSGDLERTNQRLVQLVNDLNARVLLWKAKHDNYDQALASMGRRIMRMDAELGALRRPPEPVVAVKAAPKRGRPRKAPRVAAPAAVTLTKNLPERSDHWRYPLRRTQRVTEEDAQRLLAKSRK